ncbi:MAG: ParA family partition ATPase [Alphaproteobacteria bacterium]|nr:ParA family partition ATPase [Alphaproteobacteria bacterium]
MAKIITIAQQKGGAGKTTLAAHLAVALSQKGNRVAIVDIDPQGSLSHWHRIREEKFGEGYTGLTFTALSGWRVGSEVARLQKTQDFVIIDSPPHTETEARTAIRSADLIVIPVQPSPTDLWATKATLELAKAEKIPVRVVLNRVSANSKMASMIADELPQLAETTIGNRVLFAAALMEGRTATELEPTSHAAREIKALVKELLQLVADKEPEESNAAPSKRVLEPA